MAAFARNPSTSLVRRHRLRSHPRKPHHRPRAIATPIIIVVGIICLLGVIFSPQLVWVLAPGYAAVPGKFQLAVHLTRIMFPFLVLIVLAPQVMGMLNSCDKFGVPAMAFSLFNIGSICFGLALGFWLGPYIGITPIVGMAYGVVVGGALQLASARLGLYP